MVNISIIIVNYRTEIHLTNCLNSIKITAGTDYNYEIIVVDNFSGNDELRKIEKDFPNVKFIYLNSNNGFGYGCNKGSEFAQGEYLLFLNPDIEAEKNSINCLYSFAKKNPSAAALTGLLKDESGELQYCYNYFPSTFWMFTEAFGIMGEKVVYNLLQRNEIKECLPFSIDWAHGACLMIRRDVFFEVNGFDENIFLYYEDVDIQKKIKDKGYQIYCVPGAMFYHFERSSVRDDNSQRVYFFYMHKSKLYYMRKYFPFLKRSFIRLMFIAGYISKIPMLPLRTKFKYNRKNTLRNYIIILGVYTGLLKNI